MTKTNRSQLNEVQKDPVDLETTQALSSVEYYNRYLRKQGEPVLTQKRYDEILFIKGKKLIEAAEKSLKNEQK